MSSEVLVSVMGVVTVVAIYFWWARKPRANAQPVPHQPIP